jgi:hypothetical protein
MPHEPAGGWTSHSYERIWLVLSGPLREVDVGLVPRPSGSGALVLHGEDAADCLVVFMAMATPDYRPRQAAVATFHHCAQSIFGYPNDEAYSAVPQATYGFFEVLDSDWSDRLSAFNRLSFPDAEPSGGLRHYFMGCHDSSGQFLAAGLSVEVFEDYMMALAEALRRYDLVDG